LKKKISGIVFSSMISALDDFMGIDGLNSILKFAQLDEYVDNKPSKTHSISLQRFRAFIESIRTIMGYGTDEILFHYGKNYLALKFAAFMTELSTFVKNFEEWAGGSWDIIKDEPDEKIIQILNSPFSYHGGTKSFSSCNIVRGIFEILMEQITGEKFLCEETKCTARGDNYCEFIIKKIQ